MAKKYDKLVRDKIPQICKNNGVCAVTSILSEDEFERYLKLKLVEESLEYLENNDIDEIADVLEVIYSILNLKNKSMKEIDDKRLKKKEERGGFEKRILLKETYDFI